MNKEILIQMLFEARETGMMLDELADEILARFKQAGFTAKVINAQKEEMNLDDPHFDGAGYEKEVDQKRLTKNLFKVFHYMNDGEWHLLRQITAATNVPEASASAHLREFRKAKWGSHTVLRERYKAGKGLWKYKLVPNKDSLTWEHYQRTLNV